MTRLRTPAALTVLAMLLGACALGRVGSWTPQASPSLEPELAAEAESVREAFLERMADPDITYRVKREVVIGPEDGDGDPGVSVMAYYDVAGDAYAGQVQIRGRVIDAIPFPDLHVYVVDGTTHVDTGNNTPGQEWLTAELPSSAQRPNAIADLGPADLIPVGGTADGTVFEVVPWILGDPVLEWAELGIVEGSDAAPTTVESHATRLTIDPDGTPQRLSSAWIARPGGSDAPVEGTLSDVFDAVGLYVKIIDPDPAMPPRETSHDLIDDVDGEWVHTGPWFEVLPTGDQATIEIVLDESADGIDTGMEGGIVFVRSHAADGSVILDTKIDRAAPTLVSAPAGEQEIVVYARSCDGNCALLDVAVDVCSVATTIEPGERYDLRVAVQSHRSDCLIGPGG
jgi:hypothetical protein